MWDGGGEGEGRKCTDCPIKASAVRIEMILTHTHRWLHKLSQGQP